MPNPIFCPLVLVISIPSREHSLCLFLFLLKKLNCSSSSPSTEMIVGLEASVTIDCAAAFQKKVLKIVSLNLSEPLEPNVSAVPAV